MRLSAKFSNRSKEETALKIGKRTASIFLMSSLVYLLVWPGSTKAASLDCLSLAEIPDEALVQIRTPDSSELSEVIAATLSQSLAAKGFRIEDDGELIVRFAATIDEFDQGKDRERSLGLSSRGSSEEGVEGMVEWHLRNPKAEKKVQRKLKLRVSISRPSRPPLWTGYAVEFLAGTDRRTLSRALARLLVDHLGETVSLSDVEIRGYKRISGSSSE